MPGILESKIRLGPKVRSDLDRLREQMDAMAADSPAVPDPEPAA